MVRSLFGTLRVPSPRWRHCGSRTFRPVAALLPERTTPELGYLQARFAAQASYQVAAAMLAEVLPLGRTLHAATVRRHTPPWLGAWRASSGPSSPVSSPAAHPTGSSYPAPTCR